MPRCRHERFRRQADPQESSDREAGDGSRRSSGAPDRATPGKTGHDDLTAVAPAAVAMTDVSPILNREMFDALIEEIDIDGVRAALAVFLSEFC